MDEETIRMFDLLSSRITATRLVLQQVVAETAREAADPKREVTGLFERISARIDSLPIEGRHADDLARDEMIRAEVAKFFQAVEGSLP